jgi:hypothetical protein
VPEGRDPRDADLQRILADCRIDWVQQRPGLASFDALCVSRRLASSSGVALDEAVLGLGRWARSLGGEVVDGELLWLPVDQV